MEETLPITVSSSKSLLSRYAKLNSVLNKQEAHLNFQTLAAGWYEDENKVVDINVLLLNIDEFTQQVGTKHQGEKIEISDDVMMYVESRMISCFIAITASEIEILDKETKILKGYISMKVKKVMNKIAEKLTLVTLPL